MKDFAALFSSLDQTNKTNDKINILKNYFEKVNDDDKVWTLALFTDRKPKRPVNSTLLKNWAIEMAGISPWLFEESYHVVGDLAETIALLLPPTASGTFKSLSEWVNEVISLAGKEESEKKLIITNAWLTLTTQERFVFNKILTGSFRIGVSQNLIIAALASFTGLEKSVLSHRLMGHWSPAEITFQELLYGTSQMDDISRPYPFFLSYALEEEPEGLGQPEEWLAEWKWDGIRAQLIKRNNHVFIWSRGEELVTDKFPEIKNIGLHIPDGTVLDGEILPFKNGLPLPFNVLQTRIGRKNLTSKILSEAPTAFIVYDIMEWENNDIRHLELKDRRTLIQSLIDNSSIENFRISYAVSFDSWESLTSKRLFSRQNLAEGFMLKRMASPYRTGRKRGDWWKWKVAPLTVDGVLVYAQKGHGKRADLYTDYTFAVWDNETLVPFAKAYSGLTDEEIRKVDHFVKRNTIEKFGPVRTVTPQLVFEIGFEGIQKSSRHKCGIAVRFPRILRWRHDKSKAEADTITSLQSILNVYEGGSENHDKI